MTDDDYDALSQKQLASIKRDMRISLEDAAVRATYKVMAELETEQEPVKLQYPQKDIDWQREQQIKAQASIPPQRTWVGLTDEEIKEGESKEELGHGFIQGALWAEAKLKEKNG